MSSKLEDFNLTFTSDKSIAWLLDIHGDNFKAPPFHPLLPKTDDLTGSRKRKSSAFQGYRPQKYDGNQFRINLLEGNESADDITAKKAKSFKNYWSSYKKQEDVRENNMLNLVRKLRAERTRKMQRKAQEEALRMYETVLMEDLPLDAPHVTVEMIKRHTDNLKKEYKMVSQMAQKCIQDIGNNMFTKRGTFNNLHLCLRNSMVPRIQPRPNILPSFIILPESSAYRILSYYNIGDRYNDVFGMHWKIAQNFVAHGYHPAEEIFQAIGTARLGLNDLEFPGHRNVVDELYIPYMNGTEEPSDEESASVSSGRLQNRRFLKN